MTLASTIDRPKTNALASLLEGYSTEVTTRDRKSLDAAAECLRPGSEVFIASLPGDALDKSVSTAAFLKQAGLAPVPHIVARNIASRAVLEELIGRLVSEAGVDRVLVLGGDRDKPEGEFDSSMQLLQTGVIQASGLKDIFLACYPEGHPRVADEVLEAARAEKLQKAAEDGLNVTLVSQFCFDPKPIVALAERMRAQGVTAPFRVGVAGPAERTTLVKYALMCGVGASLRALKERQDLAKNALTGETPEALLRAVADAAAARPELGIAGVHFFTFGALRKSAEWADGHLG